MNSRLVFFYNDTDVHQLDEPVFYDDVLEYPDVLYVLDNYDAIRRELAPYVDGELDIPYVHPSPPKMSGPHAWKNIYFKNYLLPYRLGRKHFPRTFRLFAERPGITLAGVTMLAPGGRLQSHCGETNALIRCHLGLKVPGTLPALGLKVNGESICWEEGKVFAFNDAYQHEAWNETSEPRYVLAFDIIRPQFSRYRTLICAYCLAVQVARLFLERSRLYHRPPERVTALVAKAIVVPLWAFISLASLSQSVTCTIARWWRTRVRHVGAAGEVAPLTYRGRVVDRSAKA